MMGGTGFEPVAPAMSRPSHNAQINIFQRLTRAYEDRLVRTKTEQNGIYRQVSARPMDVYAKVLIAPHLARQQSSLARRRRFGRCKWNGKPLVALWRYLSCWRHIFDGLRTATPGLLDDSGNLVQRYYVRSSHWILVECSL